MLNASLRRSGGSFIMTVPLSYVEQNHLEAGSLMELEISGDTLSVKPRTRHRRTLKELLAATPEGLHRVEGWDELSPVGAEL